MADFNQLDKQALDRYITGNWGEDSVHDLRREEAEKMLDDLVRLENASANAISMAKQDQYDKQARALRNTILELMGVTS